MISDIRGTLRATFKSKNIFCWILTKIWIVLSAMLFIVLIASWDISMLILFAFVTSLSLVPAIIISVRSDKVSLPPSSKSWLATLLLGILFGIVGAHRFYNGKKVTGTLYILTLGGFFILWIIDIIVILSGRFTDKQHRLVQPNLSWAKPYTTRAKNRISRFSEPLSQDSPAETIQPTKQSASNTDHIFTEVVVPGEYERHEEIAPQPIVPSDIAVDHNTDMDSVSAIIQHSDLQKQSLVDERSLAITPRPAALLDIEPAIIREVSSAPEEPVLIDRVDSADESSAPEDPKEMSFYDAMKDFVDRAEPETSFTPFTHFYPTYSSMNERQEAWYFYWRSEVRAGRFLDTDLSYIFVHVYELLNGYGWETPEDGYQQLMGLWLAYRVYYPSLDNYLYEWIFTFAYIYNLTFEVPSDPGIRLPSQPVIRDMLIERYRHEQPLELPFAIVDMLCDYALTSSSFYQDGHQMLMHDAIPQVIARADAYLLDSSGKGMLDLLGPERPVAHSYSAFNSAVYYGAYKQINVTVMPYTSSLHLRSYINELVHYTENRLREMKDYRGRLRDTGLGADLTTLIDDFLASEYSSMEVEPEPEHALGLDLNIAKIAALRAQSDAVRDSLKVDEAPHEPRETLSKPPANEHRTVGSPTARKEAETAHPSSDQTRAYFDTTHLPEPLEHVIIELSPVHREVLYALLTLGNPQETLERLADEAMSMPEILLDDINDVAMQFLDDILIDSYNDSLSILEQYESVLRRSVIMEVH